MDDEHFETLTAAVFCARFKPDIVRSRWRAIRRCFAYFNLAVVASWPEQEIERLMQQPGIIRNRKKIAPSIRCYLACAGLDPDTHKRSGITMEAAT